MAKKCVREDFQDETMCSLFSLMDSNIKIT